jgi:hypothetical protein
MSIDVLSADRIPMSQKERDVLKITLHPEKSVNSPLPCFVQG